VIAGNLPILQVVIALLSAPVCLVLRYGRDAWWLAVVATGICFVAAVYLTVWVAYDGALSYALGGWEAPWGIEYRIDLLGGILLTTISAGAVTTVCFGRELVDRSIGAQQVPAYYCLYLLVLAGLLGIAATGDFFNLFVFLEISSLASYVLIGLGRDGGALVAAYRYLIMGSLGATFYVIGLGLLYMMTGTLNMADMANQLPAAAGSRTLVTAIAFLIVGLSLKAGLFPLHGWLPSAYAQAPTAVAPFLAATSTKVAFYVLLRVLFTLFAAIDPAEVAPLLQLLALLAVAGLIGGSVLAFVQDNGRRMLAYSGIAQVGAMILGVSLMNQAGVAASIVTLFNHAMTMALLFMCFGVFRLYAGADRIADLDGLAETMPRVAAAVTVGGLSLIGLPLTSGFVSKWALTAALLDRGLWPLAVVVLLSSILTLVYMGRIIVGLYLRPVRRRAEMVEDAPWGMFWPILMLAVVNLLFGVFGWLPLQLAQAAALELLGAAP
jgi:multicomponent Na+:H+ antiporter subunit D